MTAIALDGAGESWASPLSARFATIAWPIAGILLVLAMQATMIVTRAINWDEFWFNTLIEQFSRGGMNLVLQTLHVRLFSWLSLLPGSEIDHIVLGRVVMWGCELITLGCIVAIGSRFASRQAAWIAALAWIAAGYTLQHGFSFRTDPMLTALAMGGLAILARSDLRWPAILGFGALAGLAAMISVKIVLLAPAFAGLAWWRWSRSGLGRPTALRILACAAASLIIFALLFAWHSATLGQTGEGATDNAGTTLSQSLAWMFFIGVPPYWPMLLKAVATAPILFALALCAPLLILRIDRPWAEKIALLALLFPLLLPFCYTNSAAYFYPYMLAPVSAASAVSVDAALRRFPARTLVLAICAIALAVFAVEDRQAITRQRVLVEAAGTIFPHRVDYFDLDGMLARFDKANDFFTPWGLSVYRQNNIATHRAAMEERVIPLLLNNSDALDAAIAGRQGPLLPADAEALRDNYLPYWGPLHVAGKRISAGEEAVREFLVPGAYRVAGSPVLFDGARFEAGSIVTPSRGLHSVSALGPESVLTWADLGPRPTRSWLEGPLYVDF